MNGTNSIKKPVANGCVDHNDINSRTITDNCYIFDVAHTSRIIACRSSMPSPSVGDGFLDLIGITGREILLDYVVSFEPRPLLLKTTLGYAIIYGNLYPSSLLCPAVFPLASPEAVFRVASSGKYGEYLIPPLSGCPGNPSKKDADAIAAITAIRNLGDKCFSDIPLPKCGNNKVITSLLLDRIHNLALFVGCAVKYSAIDEIICSDGFDMPLFTAYIMLSLMLCRHMGDVREACITLENIPEGPAATVTFKPQEELYTNIIPEVITIALAADRLNMLFEKSCSPSCIRMKFCPVRKDWSYLELKSPSFFSWDS